MPPYRPGEHRISQKRLRGMIRAQAGMLDIVPFATQRDEGTFRGKNKNTRDKVEVEVLKEKCRFLEKALIMLVVMQMITLAAIILKWW